MFSLKNFDWLNFLVLILILSLGTVTVLSVNPQLFTTQITYVILGILVYLFLSSLDFRIFEGLGNFFYLMSILILIAPLFWGIVSRGAVRWIQIGGITFQPSEFAKPLLIIFFAKYWLSKNFNFKNLVAYFGYLFFPLFLIFRQPDLGSTLVVLVIALGIMFFTEINWKQIIVLALFFLLAVPFSVQFLKDYQKQRIVHFLNPWADPLGAGYNVIQSVISIGSGGLTGKGFGKGTQSHLAFLPERHTDFIFASFAEEFGFLGSVGLILLYFLLLRRILQRSLALKDIFNLRISLGVFFLIFFQVLVNIGMNLGVLPITGITLPLFSYGGSSLVSTMICLGLTESVFRLTEEKSRLEIGVFR